jgi:hypothetical protein
MTRFLVAVLAALVAFAAPAKSAHRAPAKQSRIERQLPANAQGSVHGSGEYYQGYPLSDWLTQRDRW